MELAKFYPNFSIDECIEYDEWMMVLKKDFDRFRNYVLCNIDGSEKLLSELNRYIFEYVDIDSSDIITSGPREYLISKGEKYFVYEFPYYCKNSKCHAKNIIVVSNNYKEFIFVSNDDLAIPHITRYYIENNKVCVEDFFEGIDMSWHEDTFSIEENLNILRHKTVSSRELSGFAHYGDEIDDFEIHNRSLAWEYYDAIKYEDFERLGDLGQYTLCDISSWLMSAAENDSFLYNEAQKIKDGSITTKYGKTFANAVGLRNIIETAGALILNNSIEPELYASLMQYGCDISEYLLNNILEYAGMAIRTNFIQNLLKSINRRIEMLDDYKKVEFLERIKQFFEYFEDKDLIIKINETLNYEWVLSILGKDGVILTKK